jgi:hypothetical protein
MRFTRTALFVSACLGVLSPATGEALHSAPRAMAPRAAPSDVLFPCQPDARTLCLNHGRFEVTANFVAGSVRGDAQVVALTDDTGYLWFFSSDNVEIVVKVLDGCGVNGNYWVFAGGLTDVAVCLRVTDSQNAGFVLACNRPNTPFQPIQNTAAFPACP